MSLPTDFHREVADRVQQPGFDAVLDRAGANRRRRRTTIASGLAAAVVVAGLGYVVGNPGGSDRRSPDPAPPALTTWDGSSAIDTRLPVEVQDVLGQDEVFPWAVVGSGTGIAVLWRACPGDSAGDNPCRFVLVTRTGEEVTGTVVDDLAPRLAAAPEGWLLESSGAFALYSGSGRTGPVIVTGPGDPDVMAGDTAVDTTGGVRLLRGIKLIPIPSPPGDDTTAAYVTPDGRVVTVSSSGGGPAISATDDGQVWERALSSRSTEPVSDAVVAGSGDHVAVAFLGDAPDGSVPLVGVWVSHDAGRTWISARGLDNGGTDRVRDPSSIAVTPTGSTYVTTGSDGLIRIDPDGNAMATPASSSDTSVFALGDAVCLVAEAGRIDQLRCSTDDGTTWVPQPLPGFS